MRRPHSSRRSAAIGTFAAFAHFYSGDGRAALAWGARVLEVVGTDDVLGKEIVGYSPRVAMLWSRTNAYLQLGRFAEAWPQLEEVARVAEASHELEIFTWQQYAWAALAYACGSSGAESALEHARRGVETAETLDNEHARTAAYTALGVAYLVGEQAAAARDALREAATIIRDQCANRAFLPLVLAHLAAAQLALGERAEAIASAREGIDLGRAGGCGYHEAQAQLVLAEALLATDDALPRAEIESALARAENLVEAIAARSLSPRILELRGRLAATIHRGAGSDRLLRDALELYRTIGATGHAQRLAKEIGA